MSVKKEAKLLARDIYLRYLFENDYGVRVCFTLGVFRG